MIQMRWLRRPPGGVIGAGEVLRPGCGVIGAGGDIYLDRSWCRLQWREVQPRASWPDARFFVVHDWTDVPVCDEDSALAEGRGREAAGWQLVPDEATPDMRDAGKEVLDARNGLAGAYRAMLAAAPRWP